MPRSTYYRPSLRSAEEKAEAKQRREEYLRKRRSMPFDAEAWYQRCQRDASRDKVPALIIHNVFGEGYGRITVGSSQLVFETIKKAEWGDSKADAIQNLGGWECRVYYGKEKPFESHPDWRPIAVEWDSDNRKRIFLESWDEIYDYIKNNELESCGGWSDRVWERKMYIHVYKHPIQ